MNKLLGYSLLWLGLVTSSYSDETVTTADGNGFDGALIEINYSGAYDGGFDTVAFRNNVYQNGNLRHLMTVLKFDLSAVPLVGDDLTDSTLRLVANGATSGSRTRSVGLFTGDDSLITTEIGYNAANPFIDDAYVGEVVGDTDFKEGTVVELLTFNNSTGDGAVDVIGAGNLLLLDAVKEALDGDKTLTFILYGGNQQYLPYSDDNADPAIFPSLTLVGNSSTDTDGDGLPDLWEDEWFGNDDNVVTQEELDLQAGDGDFDEDEFDNLAEFNAGSDPTDFFSIPGDVDGDELLDLWEDENFGNLDGVPTEAELALQSGFDDPDGDFDTNTEEMENDTNPNDQLSFFDNENGDGTGDGLPDNWEFFYFFDTSTATSPDGDVDGDEFTNFEEFLAGSDPNFNLSTPTDIDGDGVPDLWEDEHYGNNDGIVDPAELNGTDGTLDLDGDEFDDLAESNADPVPSDPNDPTSVPGDADGDGLPDSWELTFFSTILDQNGGGDPDGDLYTNAEEFDASTDPDDHLSFPGDSDNDDLNDRWEELYFDGDLNATNDGENDSDGDGSSDFVEYDFGSNPNNADSVPGDIDGDGLLDDDEVFYFGDIFTYDGDDDPDRDFATNLAELDAGTDPTIRTLSPDLDVDGFGDVLGDAWEIFSFGSTDVTDDPDGDPDGDGFTNFEEYAAATNGNDPLSTPDEDGDGLPDGWELFHFTLEGEDPVTDRETILARQTGADDFDGDDASNKLELLSGTNPNDGAEVPNPAVVSTALGSGADTFLSNDTQGATSAPTVAHGTEAGGEARDNRASRVKLPMIRFDISQLGGDLTNVALRINTTFGSPANPGTLTVYGLVDGDPGELWDEATTSYSNAPGILEGQRDVISLFARDPEKLRLLGTIDVQPDGENLSDPATLDLKSFLEADTDGVVTIVLHAPANRWYGFATKEEDLNLAPALVIPNGELTVASEMKVESAVLDSVADTFTMTVAGLTIGEEYHVESSGNLAVFTPVAGSTFTAAAATQDVVTPADPDVDTLLFFRISEGAEP